MGWYLFGRYCGEEDRKDSPYKEFWPTILPFPSLAPSLSNPIYLLPSHIMHVHVRDSQVHAL
jgi:hypothetical protein